MLPRVLRTQGRTDREGYRAKATKERGGSEEPMSDTIGRNYKERRRLRRADVRYYRTELQRKKAALRSRCPILSDETTKKEAALKSRGPIQSDEIRRISTRVGGRERERGREGEREGEREKVPRSGMPNGEPRCGIAQGVFSARLFSEAIA